MKITVEDLMRHAFVLTSSPRRAKRFERLFTAAGLLPLPVPYTGRYVDRGSREYAVNRHFVAAHLSHFEIVEKARSAGWPFVCIFEEDATPCRHVAEKLAQYLAAIPDDADLVKLGYVPDDGRFVANPASSDYERLDDPRCVENYLGGSHAYIVFPSFYEVSARAYETYRREFEPQICARPLHHPKFLTDDERRRFWFYEWMMTPNVYRHPNQAKMYAVNLADNLFAQYEYVTWNEVTRRQFDERTKDGSLAVLRRKFWSFWYLVKRKLLVR